MSNNLLGLRPLRRWIDPLYYIHPSSWSHPSSSDFGVDQSEARHLTRGSDLENLFFSHQGRQAHKWVHYLDAYDRHLAPYRGQPVRLLEIGVCEGGSLQVWKRYLGEQSVIYGIDIDERCAAFGDAPGITVRIGSQDDPVFLRSVVAEMGGVDVVIDDGSHLPRHQARSFDVLFPLLDDGGLYVVEDLHTAYWPPSGGLRRRGTFIERTKDLIDGMHAWYYDRPAPRHGALAKTEIESICVHDSVVYIEKRRRQRPMDTQVGGQSL